MINCQKCGKKLKNNAKFCSGCGAGISKLVKVNEDPKVVKTIYCPQCGSETLANEVSCSSCGFEIPTKKQIFIRIFNFLKSVNWKKVIPFVAICLAIIIAITLVLSSILLSSKSDKSDNVLYLKDNEIYHTLLKKIEPFEVTSNLVYNDEQLYESTAHELGMIAFLTEDNKSLFYPDKIDMDNDVGFSLYYRNVSKPNKEASKIDSDIRKYFVNKKGSKIYYIKGDDNRLYFNDLKNKEKIANNVVEFYINPKGTKVIYRNDEKNIYVKELSKEKEKIDSDSIIQYVTKDLSIIFYLKNGSLYKKQENKNKEKIASDVVSIAKAYDSGDMYFIKSDKENLKLSDFVVDDLKESDSQIQEPNESDYPNYWDYDSAEDYDKAVNEYKDLCQNYLNKTNRDEIRNVLNEQDIELTKKSLYYYDGDESFKMTDSMAQVYAYAENKPIIIYSCFSESETPKVKFSEIVSIQDIRELVDASLHSLTDKFVGIEAIGHTLNQTNAKDFIINDNGTIVYYLDEYDRTKDSGDLYEVTISNSQIDNVQVYDTDVSNQSLLFFNEDSIIYLKDTKDQVGDMYIDKSHVDSDVNIWYKEYDKNSNRLIYFVDWDVNKQNGTLKLFNGRKNIKISDDVHRFYVAGNSKIAYLYDYSLDRQKGDLYLYNKNKENTKIDDDVCGVIPIISTYRYGDSFYNGYYIYDAPAAIPPS